MNIPTVPSPDWHEHFAHNLEQAIAFHRCNQNDPHNIGCAVLVALEETREAFVLAINNRRTFKPSAANDGGGATP